MSDQDPADGIYVRPAFRYRRAADNRILVEGEIDMATVEALRPVMLASQDAVELDLSAVTFMDSAGIRLLLTAKQQRPITIVNASPAVTRVIELLGLTSQFSGE